MVPCFWVLRPVQLLANSKAPTSASHFKPTLPPPQKKSLRKVSENFSVSKTRAKITALWIPGCNYPSRPQISFVRCSKEIRALEANFRESSITRFVHLFCTLLYIYSATIQFIVKYFWHVNKKMACILVY